MNDRNEEYEYIGKNIGKVHRMSMMYFSKKFSKFNVGAGQCFLLVRLYENQGITQEELSSMLSLDKTTIARNLKKLDDQGYIKRIKREDDKRSYSIDVTEKSLKIKDEVYRILHSWEEKLNSCLTNDESKQLIILLNKLNNINLLKEEEI